MKQLRPTMPRILVLGMLFLSLQLVAQKQTKTYNEKFNVGTDAVLDINTSYADIQFETWEKNEVSVEAVIELEGATEEEAEAYFKNSGIKILGNSKTVEIKTYGNNSWSFRNSLWQPDPSSPVTPIAPFPEMGQLFMDFEMPELPPMPEMPPMPPIPNVNFDYEAFQKDGDKYLKKWKKEFNKNFDKEYQEEMEAWGKEFAARAEAKRDQMEERREAMEVQREEMKLQREEMREQAQEDRERAMKEAQEAREKVLFEMRDTDAPTIFYRSEDGESKNYKVKKTIKIKMPKSATLKMNVRHGEVKLAANTKNLKATLAYASLQATTIEGDRTQINASYSPVKVAQWKYGNLNTSFSEAIELDAVTQLTLTATSSEVLINKLIKGLISKNDLGLLTIKAVDPNFTKLDIRVQNGELQCEFPSTPFLVQARNIRSEFNYPSSWSLSSSKSGQEISYTGFSRKGTTSKIFTLNSSYSNIVLK
ncbi:MAG: hypothetical protein HKP53_05160 [Eudoraea sp.]|nr:hypothetical protein [Eudoraea sp.]